MLEHLPRAVGTALRRVRPGTGALICMREKLLGLPDEIELVSNELDGTALPPHVTADGGGMSPALAWRRVPEGTAELVLVVEDADPPTPKPFVHLIVFGIAGRDGAFEAGALSGPRPPASLGKNSYMKIGWLPPDPPAGHGPHRYLFQMFALRKLSMLTGTPGRADIVAALARHAFARGLMLATHERP